MSTRDFCYYPAKILTKLHKPEPCTNHYQRSRVVCRPQWHPCHPNHHHTLFPTLQSSISPHGHCRSRCLQPASRHHRSNLYRKKSTRVTKLLRKFTFLPGFGGNNLCHYPLREKFVTRMPGPTMLCLKACR